MSKSTIAAFGGQVRADWVPGVYFSPELYRAAIVAIDELPQTQDTLWLRILGRDRVQRQAIQEVLALAACDQRRSLTLQLLATWKITIEVSGTIDENRELLMVLSEAYLEWERATEQRGGEREARSLILRQLTRRVGLTEQARARIDRLSIPQLEELAEALLDFTDLSDLEAWLAER